jgi:hypothetical protein
MVIPLLAPALEKEEEIGGGKEGRGGGRGRSKAGGSIIRS